MITAPVLADAAAISAGDTAWVLASTALVMVMTVGLAFFYGGLVRPKNALNTMMMSMVALGLISVQWVLVGYSIGFGHGTPWWGGLGWAGFRGVGLDPDPAYARPPHHRRTRCFKRCSRSSRPPSSRARSW